MREIKFRAWYPPEEKYHYFTLKGIAFMRPAGAFDVRFILAGEIEQYTGLKDKNGKEVYEGDVVRYPRLAGSGKPYVYAVIGFDNSLESCDCCFSTFHGSGFPIYISSDYKDKIEVVGNIYENPELLENKIKENK